MKVSWLAIIIILIGSGHSVLAKNFYRYKNLKGAVEIKDKITKEMEFAGYDELSSSGKLIRHHAPVKTIAETNSDILKKRNDKIKAIEARRQLHKDADLLRQFASIGDIIRNRDSQLLALEQRIRIQNSKEGLLKIQLEDQQQQAATYERLGQRVAHTLENDIQSSQQQISNNQKNIAVLETQKIQVEKSFEKDIIRYKELESVRIALRKNDRERTTFDSVIYDCPDKETCDRAWQLAQIYARDHATGQIEIVSGTLILTSRPNGPKDVAISFSRIPSSKNMQIVLEVSCSTGELGTKFCKSKKVIAIRNNYIEYVRSRLKT